MGKTLTSRSLISALIAVFLTVVASTGAGRAASCDASNASRETSKSSQTVKKTKKSAQHETVDEIVAVLLLNPSDREATEHCYGRYFLTPWKAGEKEQFTRVLKEVSNCAPGLITRAAAGKKLHVCRVKDLPFSATTAGSFDAEALTRPDSILIPDVFFEGSRKAQLRCFLHELVHSADMAGQIALSRDWIRFAHPTISELRCEATFGKPERKAGRLVPPHNAWPTMYGCENLTEALAEYFAAHAVGSPEDFEFDPAFRRQFAPRLMQTSKKHARFMIVYKQGSKLYNERKYDAAIEKLLEAKKLDGSAPGTHSCLAACYAYKGDYDTSLKYAATADRVLKKTGVPAGEPDQIMVMEVKGLSYLHQGKLDAAVEAFNDVLGQEPNNNWCRSMRARCRESQNKYSDAAWDMAAIYGKTRRLIDPLLAARADSNFTMKCLNANLDKAPKDAVAVQKRAEFFEFLGDKEMDKNAQLDLYRRALGDFQRSLTLDDCEKARTLGACARLNLKIGADQAAKDLCEQVIAIEPFNIEAKIVKLRLLEKSGNIKDVRTEYETLKFQIQRSVPSQQERQHVPDRLKLI